MTQPLRECIATWAWSESLDPEGIMSSLTELIVGGDNPLQALEIGQLSRPDVAPWLAGVFASHGPEPDPDNLFERMFAPLRTNIEMRDLLCDVRSQGLRTGLVSNSWGDSYDRTLWDEAFDAVVISGEVGLRKPSMEIFELALSLIDLPAEDVVYVDDEYPNVLAAASYGFRAVHCDPNDPLRVQRVRESVI